MDHLMAALDRREDFVPLPLDVCAVGVELGLQSGFGQNPFTGGNVSRERYAGSQGDDAQINNHFHGLIVLCPLRDPLSQELDFTLGQRRCT